ncbi:hypothetical protein Tco_1068677 [Tanacetum coccineum]|uniref:Uncharacterized protein n=1 Tax=Tanacetum coccineum TaxID=301880 RepID=A0ABQ5HGD7_9ASTR
MGMTTGKDTSLTNLKRLQNESTIQLLGYEESPGYSKQRYHICGLNLWSQSQAVGAQIRVRGPKTVGASRIVEDEMKNTLKMKHPPRREDPKLHRYEDPPESLGLRLLHEGRLAKACSDIAYVTGHSIFVEDSCNERLAVTLTRDGFLDQREQCSVCSDDTEKGYERSSIVLREGYSQFNDVSSRYLVLKVS